MTLHLLYSPNFVEIASAKNFQSNSMNGSVMPPEMQKEILHIILLEKDDHNLLCLQNELSRFKGDHIISGFTSIKKAKDYLLMHFNTIDLVIANINLSDGSVFPLFEKLNIVTPIIFLADSEHELERANQYNCIDYLIKPIQSKNLLTTISLFVKKKYQLNRQVFQRPFVPQVTKERIVGKIGMENIILLIDDVVAFYTQSSIVYAINNESKRFIVEKKLNELERELAKSGFYRINRQYLINIKYIKGYKPFEKVKLQIALKDVKLSDQIIVSQDYTPGFKKWVESY